MPDDFNRIVYFLRVCECGSISKAAESLYITPQNDIVKIQSQLKGNMIMMGGIDAAKIDFPDATEEEVRAEVRRVCSTYIPGGHFIPSPTAGGPGSINTHIDPIIEDEIARFAAEFGE